MDGDQLVVAVPVGGEADGRVVHGVAGDETVFEGLAKDFCIAPGLGLQELHAQCVAHLDHAAAALFLDRFGDLRLHLGSGCPGAGRVGEDVDLLKADLLREGHGVLKVLLGLEGEAHHDVRRDGTVGERLS